MKTPDLGIDFDPASSASMKPPGTLAKYSEPAMKWFRTVVDCDAHIKFSWSDSSMS